MLRLRKHEARDPKILLDLLPQKSLELSQKIKALNGHYIDSKCFEKTATHLITDTIRCTEKFLGACVRGLWVLSPKYIEDSYHCGVWLKEEDYEHSLQLEDQAFDLVAAARRWRWRIANHNEQPFTGMHVAVLLRSNSAYYEKLLIYGGAQVFKLSLPLRDDANLSQILYVFTDQSYKDDVQILQEYGLICLDYMFIVDTIIKDEQLDFLEYMVRKDSDTSLLQHRSVLCFTGMKSTRISYVDHKSEANIQTIKAGDGIYKVDLLAEQPQERTLKCHGSKAGPLVMGSSPCIYRNTGGSVNTAAKGSFSSFANDHAYLKNVSNLSRKKNVLTESNNVVFAGSQRACDGELDSLKANVQKNTLKELNGPILMHQLHKSNIIDNRAALAEKCHVHVSQSTVKAKTQIHTSETTNRCIKVNEAPYSNTEVLSSLNKHISDLLLSGAAHVETKSVTNARMSSKCESTFGSSDSTDKSVSTSHRQDNDDKTGCDSWRENNEDDCQSTTDVQNTEGKHRSLWSDVIYIDDDELTEVNTSEAASSLSTVSNVPSLDGIDKSASTSNRQDNKNKTGCASCRKIKEDNCQSTIDSSLSTVSNVPSLDGTDKSASTSNRQDNKDKTGCGSWRENDEDNCQSTTGIQDNEGKHRSLWSDVIYIDDDKPAEVNTSESVSSSPTISNVPMDSLQLSTSSPNATSPTSPGSLSTPGVDNLSPNMAQINQIFPPRRLSWLSKNLQACLLDFGFSSVSKNSKDTKSKEHLFVTNDAPATVNSKSIKKRKKLAKAVSESLLKLHTQQGLAKRRVPETTLSHVETRDNKCPDLSSVNQNEKRTQQGLGKQRVLDMTLSHIETRDNKCPDLSSNNQNEKPLATTEGSQSNVCGTASAMGPVSSYLKTSNSSMQSELLNTELSHETTQTQRVLAKRRAVDCRVLLRESKISRNPSRSASSGDIISPVTRDAETDVCGHNYSEHGSNTKNYCNKMNNSPSRSSTWNTQLSIRTTQTQRGLAKKKASFPHIEGTNPGKPPQCPADGCDDDQICVTAKGDESDHDSGRNIIHPSSQLSSSCGQTTKGCKHTVISRSILNSVENGNDLRQLKMDPFVDSSCTKTPARMAADSLNAVKSEKETVPTLKLVNFHNSAPENNSTDRSLFKSFSNYFNGIKQEMSCSVEIHFESVVKSDPGSSSELTVFAEEDNISPVSKNSQDIKELNVLQKIDAQVKIPTAADSQIDDYIELPTPPSVTCHDSDAEAVETTTAVSSSNKADSDELPLACNPSTMTEHVLDKEVQQHTEFQREVCNNRNLEGNTSTQSSESNPLWPLTYLLSLNRHDSDNKPFLPVIYGQWMESAREMGFYHQAIAHAKPTKSRLATSLLLSELVHLARTTDAQVCSLAISHLYTWLELHPPLTPVTVKLYVEAFEFSSENSVLFDIIRDIMDETKQSSAILLLEYFISVFEINFDFCLRSEKKTCLQNCLFIKWLWRNSYTTIYGRTVNHLLQLFEYTITAPDLNCRASTAACALLSLACECLRLASVRWDQRSPKFIIDSVITLAHNIATRIHSSLKTGDKSKIIVLNMLRPTWLKLLVSAKLLSYYNDYLLSDPIHVNSISVSSIVSQYFFLVPLKAGGKSDVQEHVENSHAVGHTKSLEGAFEATRGKQQKGMLTAEKVNRRNGKGESAIHIACMKNKAADLVKLLAVPGANVNLRDNIGWTPLHEACHHGSVACVELLLKHVPIAATAASTHQEQPSSKVEVDAPGPDGLTPLHDAVCSNQIDVCKLLLRYGGKQLLKSKTLYNQTAIDFAQSEEMRAVLNGSSDASLLLDLSISQDLDDPAGIIDAVKEVAPLTQRYKEVTGTDCSQLASRSSCEEFLMLLTVLVSSYYSNLGPLEKCGQVDPKEKTVLGNMSIHLKLFKRHLRKLTTPEDFDKLQFRLECFESLCIYKPGNVYL
ncbi:hypothetical protein BsWGS_02197 [Bradybaena similaris]